MKLSDELISLFDTLNIENQSYALAILQSLRYAQDTMSRQLPTTDKDKIALPAKKGEDDPRA